MPATSKVCFSARRAKLRQLRLTGENGTSLVEYAFVLILFLTVLFGISGFGHALFVYHYLNESAKEGTRYAAVRGYTCGDDSSCTSTNSASGSAGPATTTDIQDYVTSIAPPSIESSKLVVSPTWTAPAGSPDVCTKQVPKSDGSGTLIGPFNNYPGCTISVQVSYPYNFTFPLLPSVTTTTAPCTAAGLCMSSESEMVISH